MNEKTSYRQSHSAPGYSQRYNANYAIGYYAAIFREIELPILKQLFSELCDGRGSLLDFACGTGRITQIAKPYFQRVVGVDVSEEMLCSAKASDGPIFICEDITKKPLNERFSVITAFRFFLNAEDSLRTDALTAIRNHLTPDGRLICNIHMNSRSIMGIFYSMTRWIPGLAHHQTLSYKKFSRMLEANGLKVEQVIWYGVLPRPGRFFARILDRWVGPTERIFAALGLQGQFAHSFMIVAQLADGKLSMIDQS